MSVKISKRIVCRLCGPAERVYRSWDALEKAMERHEASRRHRDKAYVYAEDVPAPEVTQ